MSKRVIYAWLIALVALAANFCLPLRTGLTRLSLIAIMFVVLAGAILISWRFRIIRYALFGLCLVATAFLIWPVTDPPDPVPLRTLYVRQLQQYDGTRYVYGGENALGVDCSGLVRQGMIESLILYGVQHHHPGAIRSAASLWWHDCNATNLADIPNVTRPINGHRFIPLHDTTGVRPGDLAITQSGSHVLAYLGQNRWIEADPTLGRTHLFTLDGEFKYLADELVLFSRWQWLEGSEPE